MLLRVGLAGLVALVLALGAQWLYLEAEGIYRDAQSLRSGEQAASPTTDGSSSSTPRTTTRRVEPRVSYAPTPRFVNEVEPLGPDSYEDNPAGGAQILLVDQQQDGRGDALTLYTRFVGRATIPAAVPALTQVQLPMDPEIHSLQIHAIRIERDGELIDLTQDVSVDFLRQEEALNQGFFTGQVNALIRIPGVRTEDVVDISYSVVEDHPALGGRHTLVSYFAPVTALEHFHYRALWPTSRGQVATLGDDIGLEVNEGRRVTEYQYGPGRLDAVAEPELFPSWRVLAPTLLASSFEDWNEVARWAAPFYEPQVTPAVEAIADSIQAEHEQPADQIAEALRYVQREINYFAILLGEGGYVPLSPDETLRYGEGDCKAVTLLLISILEALGFEADPALVSVNAGFGIDILPATPSAFDHVIVAARYNGRTFWLDPTLPEQAGRLSNLTVHPYGYALLANAETTDLIEIPMPPVDEPFVDVSETIEILDTGRNSRANVSLEWTFERQSADRLRYQMESLSSDATLQNFGNVYQNRFAGEFDWQAAEVEDDRGRNIITVRWAGEVELIDYGQSDQAFPTYAFGAHAPAASVVFAGLVDRDAPLILPYPYNVVQTTTVSWPEGAAFLIPRDEYYDIWTPSFRISSDVQTGLTQATLRAETRVLSPELPVEEFERANEAMENEDLDARVMVLGGELDVTARDQLLISSYSPF